MDPFDKSVQKYLEKGKGMKCKPPPVKLINQTLTMDKNLNRSWKNKVVECCYRSISRVMQNSTNYDRDADTTITIGKECKKIPSSPQGVHVTDQYIKIECHNSLKVKTFEDFRVLLLPPQEISEASKGKKEFWDTEGRRTAEKPPNILVIGVDSISRMHMIRSLPKTRDFLLANDFQEMKGYTKIGENTFPNIMAAFAGLAPGKYSSCWKTRSSKIDDCPFIWKKFSEDLKYMTAFVEDAPGIAIFNYDKTGFLEAPADYYLRPLMVANHKHHKWPPYSAKVSCLGPFNPTQFLINYIQEFIRVLDSRYPYFLLSWFTSIGHDDFNTLKTADDDFKNFLSDTVQSADMSGDNTVILFISDHGYRFGPFRETFLGYYEESLPFFFIRLPPTLKQRFPHWYANMKVNSERLTSPFDLYSTLVDLFSLGKDLENSNGSAGAAAFNKTSPSFFEASPKNRSCESSGIPQKYCICGVTPQFGSKSATSIDLGRFVVSQINSELEGLIKSSTCISLKFNQFLYGREVGVGEVWNNFGKMVGYTDYLLALKTLPGEGKFEAKVRVFKNSTQLIIGDVSRINSYEGQSDCITDYRLKNYCMCKAAAKTIPTQKAKTSKVELAKADKLNKKGNAKEGSV